MAEKMNFGYGYLMNVAHNKRHHVHLILKESSIFLPHSIMKMDWFCKCGISDDNHLEIFFFVTNTVLFYSIEQVE